MLQDWVEQLEMIALICNWDKCTKLVNLTTHLCEQAYTFYKSYPKLKWKHYPTLVAELTTRFTPVWIHAVQNKS